MKRNFKLTRDVPKSLHETLQQMITKNLHRRFLEARRKLIGRRKVQFHDSVTYWAL